MILENTRIRAWTGLVFVLLAPGASLPGDTNPGPSTLPGVGVESVGKGSSGEKAGVWAGDLLLSWARAAAPPANPQAAGGEILSPFDLDEVESEQSPRGAVTLSGERDGKPFTADLPSVRWEIIAVPRFETDIQALYRQGGQMIQRKDTEPGIALWEEAAVKLEERRDGLPACWLRLKIGDALAAARRGGAAQSAYERAVTSAKTLGRPDVEARVWTARGRAFQKEGNLSKAGEAYREALRLRQKLSGESLGTAASLNDLGVVAWKGENLDEAGDCYTKALSITQKLAPGSLRQAFYQNNLGMVALSFGNFAAAGEWHRKALAIQETLAPGGSDMAYSLQDLGRVAMGQGDVPGAEAYFRKALAIREKLMPESLGVAFSLNQLGEAAMSRGDLVTAEDCYRRALGIREKLIPGSGPEAESLFALAGLYKAKGDLASALSFYRRSVSALEARKGKLGGDRQTVERYVAQHADYYRDLVELLARLRMTEEAFDTLERFRARSLLDMLAERDLDFARDAPAELIAEQKQTDIGYDRVQKRLGEISPGKEPEEVRELLTRLRELNKKREEIRDSMKRVSPRLASLQYPRPLNLAGVRTVLAPGTLFLSYCVGENSTLLFTLLDGTLSCQTLPLKKKELTDAVKFYLKFLAVPDTGESLLARKSRQLYASLLKPVAGEIRRAKRLLICPDNVLHLLPFAALKTDRDLWLVEEKPLSCTLSATVYAETRKPRGAGRRTVRMAAFGDPVYPGGTVGDPAGNRMPGIAGASDLAPLPFSRTEVERIGALFPGAKLFLGPEAREETAKKLDKETNILHFACHGILDERFPLNSGLALSSPERSEEGRENGVLQSWEIFEQLRIDADLVTLSACETGLGADMGGEGHVGLTRAFQYAGAHAVLSTLWSVADDSTADFMARFYGWLKKGRPASEALRLAQVSFIRDPKRTWSHPFHWAPFVLSGE